MLGQGHGAGRGARERAGCERSEKRGMVRDSSNGTNASGSESGATRRQKTQGVAPRRSPRVKRRNDIVDARDEEHGVENRNHDPNSMDHLPMQQEPSAVFKILDNVLVRLHSIGRLHSGSQPLIVATTSSLSQADIKATIQEYEDHEETETDGEEGDLDIFSDPI
ncbi:hypothetical protein K438DRAFT_1929996 [Mycena galopus ATCC 62051]|nr:hypothetical protein K438DRAFT_1929996 [Mycena galopus ATCC 62051]